MLDQFLVLACDGVWDVMTNEDICSFITHRMKVQDNLEIICNEVIDTCLYKVSRLSSSIFCQVTLLINCAGKQRQHEYNHHRFRLGTHGGSRGGQERE